MTSIAALQSAASAAGKSVIYVQGNLKGAARVDVSSDKTIIGRSGSCKFIAVFERKPLIWSLFPKLTCVGSG